ncbi:MAG: tetratricopeptide repeat protein [Candidatus Obscuribacterales bacterium]|nr:tetratricopeptide repeat protein [Candidatus Obscuribacterales bacterium]
MSADDENQDLKRALAALAEQQQNLFEQQNQLLSKIETAQKRSGKDLWDRVGAIAPILSASILAVGGAYFTMSFNQQQLKLQEAQTIERFIPHLLGDEKSKRAAILAISSIADVSLAAKMASIFASPGTVSALESIAASDKDGHDEKALKQALAKALDNMAETYSMDRHYDEAIIAYKKALNLQEQSAGSNSAELIPSLNRLSEICILHKDYAQADSLLKRALEIRRSSSGPDSLMTAEQLRRLAALYKEEGLESKSHGCLEQALAIEQKFPGTASGGVAAAKDLTVLHSPETSTAENNAENAESGSSVAEKSSRQESSEHAVLTVPPELPAGRALNDNSNLKTNSEKTGDSQLKAPAPEKSGFLDKEPKGQSDCKIDAGG